MIELGSAMAHAVPGPASSWYELERRDIAPEDWARYRESIAEILERPRNGSRNPGYEGHAGAVPPGALRCDVRLRRRAEAGDHVPGREHERGRAAQPDHRGTDRLPLPVRAPRAAVRRHRSHRLHRRPAHHRHLQAHAARAPVRAALYGAGAARRADRRRARVPDRPARRRRPPRGHAPLHPDAGSRGAVADRDHVLARRVRGSRAFGASSCSRFAPTPLVDDRRRARLRRRRGARVGGRRIAPRPRRPRRRRRPELHESDDLAPARGARSHLGRRDRGALGAARGRRRGAPLGRQPRRRLPRRHRRRLRARAASGSSRS